MTAAVNVKHKPWPITLASTSSYRATLLASTGIHFDQAAPDYDEDSLSVEDDCRSDTETALEDMCRFSDGSRMDARELARRHAAGKAAALASSRHNSLIIGSDQTGVCRNSLLQKPGTHKAAGVQLTQCSGQTAIFHTAMAVLIPALDQLRKPSVASQSDGFGQATGWLERLRVSLASSHTIEVINVSTALQFRCLTNEEIERYLKLDKPYDCAGSFKLEAHGACLFDYCRSDDPSAIIGLPLMALSKRLVELGYQLYTD